VPAEIWKSFVGKEHLEKIFEEFTSYNKEPSKEIISEITTRLENAQKYLEKLVGSAEEFYESGNADELSICLKFKKIYDSIRNGAFS